MALIKCYECDKEISDRAAICPHCGAPKLETELEPAPKYEFDAAAQRFVEVRQEPVPELEPEISHTASEEKAGKVETILIVIGNLICASLPLFWMILKVTLYIVFVIPFKILTFFLIFFTASSAASSKRRRGYW